MEPSASSAAASPIDADRALEQEIRQNRKFSVAAAIAQEGSDFLKGESLVPPLVRVKNELIVFIRNHLSDPEGALQAILLDDIQADDVVCSRYFEAPLQALIELVQPLVTQEAALWAFVRRVDMRWGQLYGERPHFEVPGQPPHPDDQYTVTSVRSQLQDLLAIAQRHSV
ncbi:MAG: hypothetical protein ACFB0E_05255 [Leptolyngbyaceae cyanobacterium]